METTSLGFIDGMFFGRGRKAADGPKVLDWERAAEVCASTDEPVWAGLAEDWEYTHGLIGDGGKRVDGYVYVFSQWATPVIVVGDEYDEGTECYTAADPESDSGLPSWWLDEARGGSSARREGNES